jgi:hypothetical protein
VGRIRPEAEGLLSVAAYCGSRPSQPHGPTGAAQQPLSPAGSGPARGVQSGNKVWGNRWGQSRRKRGRCQKRWDQWGRTEAVA